MGVARLSGVSAATYAARARLSGLTAAAGASGRARLSSIGAQAGTTRRAVLSSVVALSAPAGRLDLADVDGLEPEVLQSFTAAVSGGSASSWSWSCDYPGLQYTFSGNTLSYKPPATMAGVDLTWSAQAVIGGATVSVSAVHTVLPHGGRWQYRADGVAVPLFRGMTQAGQANQPAASGFGASYGASYGN